LALGGERSWRHQGRQHVDLAQRQLLGLENSSWTRDDRFLLVKLTKTEKTMYANHHNIGIPNDHKIYQTATEYTK
jgi:hypothetical protein